MYRMLLRDIIDGSKSWHEDCYFNGELKKNAIVFIGEGKDRRKMKIIAWKWMGQEPTPKSAKYNKYCLIADSFLALFGNKYTPLPEEWTEDLRALTLRDIINKRQIDNAEEES